MAFIVNTKCSHLKTCCYIQYKDNETVCLDAILVNMAKMMAVNFTNVEKSTQTLYKNTPLFIMIA